jgi:hypothetical protein
VARVFLRWAFVVADLSAFQLRSRAGRAPAIELADVTA